MESHFPSGVQLRVSYFFSSPGPRNVQCPCENPCSEFEIHISEFPFFVHSMLLNIDMKMIGSSISTSSIFRSCKNDVSPGKHSPRTQSVLHQFQGILYKNWTVEILQLDFLTFDSLLNDLTFSSRTKRNLSRYSSVPHTVLSLSRHPLLLSST